MPSNGAQLQTNRPRPDRRTPSPAVRTAWNITALLLKEADVGTEQEVELQDHLERRLASLLEEFEHWYGRPVTMATLCTVAASAVAVRCCFTP